MKPPLHGRHWMAITGKPLGATAGAMIFQKGGNAVDAACAMLAATAEFYRSRGMRHPPEYGPLAAITPGTPGGLMTMLAEYGKLSLAEVLAPAIQLADGYPIEAQTANSMHRNRELIKQWKYSPAVLLPHTGREREAPSAGRDLRAAGKAPVFLHGFSWTGTLPFLYSSGIFSLFRSSHWSNVCSSGFNSLVLDTSRTLASVSSNST